ncbi:hypothetical protein [Plantactinospora sp. KBS50]|uniref:hypothetical protein n=1 Tax=Plantactinospora sp. KBS50 TaxID=2024580 RepID=UPI000BAACCFF|nr:hypothetical protein [Plantactinospora sp. KBS50]ASW55096.1 hypothetical protein CIK06_14265 [Plantactinospora sp. KBS50]
MIDNTQAFTEGPTHGTAGGSKGRPTARDDALSDEQDFDALLAASSFGSPRACMIRAKAPDAARVHAQRVVAGDEPWGGHWWLYPAAAESPPRVDPHAEAGADRHPPSDRRGHDTWHARAHLAQSRVISRAVDSAVDTSQWLAVAGGDLRTGICGDRGEAKAVIARLGLLLRQVPAGAFDAESSAMVLATVGHMSRVLIAERDERAALRLIRAACPHLVRLGSRHPVAFMVRRTRAEALCEMGDHGRAETLVRDLMADEERVFGGADPRTGLALFWALGRGGHLEQAETGLGALEASTVGMRDLDKQLLLHIQCRRSWLLGQRGRIDEAENRYLDVITNRSRVLGLDHSDTRDAQHSYGKLRVYAGDGSSVVKLLTSLANERGQAHGDDHFDTLETVKYLHLAQVQAQPGDRRGVKNAIDELGRILSFQDTRYGPGNLGSCDTAGWLGRMLRLREALDCREPIPDLRQIPIPGEGHRQTDPSPFPGRASRSARPVSAELVRSS